MTSSPIRVFISYSHDSEQHRRRVRQLADSLRNCGIDVRMDQYENGDPVEGWPRGMEKQIEEAESVLLICTETYLRRVRKDAQGESGHGVCWEANLIYNELYAAQTCSKKFIPVLFEFSDKRFVPKPLGASTCFLVTDDTNFEYLLRRLIGQRNSPMPPIGEVPNLPSEQPLPLFSPTSLSQVGGSSEPEKSGIRVFEEPDQPKGSCPLLGELDRSLSSGELMQSELGPSVLAILGKENHRQFNIPLDTEWLKTAIRLSDMYFVMVSSSAGDRDWQRDLAQVATPVVVAIARSLKRSPDAMASIISLCDSVAQRLRLAFIWPTSPDELNNLLNSLYGACLKATELENDEVLVILKSIAVKTQRS